MGFLYLTNKKGLKRRDFDEQFMRGFRGNIGYWNILYAEILTLIHEVQIYWK